MKRILKTLTLVLVLVFCLASTAFASEGLGGSGTGGGAGEGTQDKKDGFLATKSGYIVYTSDASGNATSDVIAFCWNGGDPYSTTGAPVVKILQTRFGQSATFRSDLSAAWGYPPFSGSSGAGGEVSQVL